MRTLLIVLVFVTIQNLAKANQYAQHYDKNTVEHKELSNMSGEDMAAMSTCVQEAMADESVLEVDHSEATDSCINDVLGDIHN